MKQTSTGNRGYSRSETGWVMLVTMLAATIIAGIIALLVFAVDGTLHAFALPPVFILVVVNFYRLSVTVDSEKVVTRLGIGLLRRTILLSDIASAEIAREAWYGGWGLRWTGKGWFYTVNSLDAVALNLKNGREFLIGTDDPKGLLAAIKERLKP